MDAPNARQLAETIADDILAGRLADGEQLLSERALAAAFGVGRPLVREALRSLEELGLVETRPGRGTFVRATGTSGVRRQVGVAIRRRGATAAQLSEARITLESQAAGLAALRASAEDIERLEETLVLLEGSEGVEHVRFDLAFHLAIATAAHNPVIEMMLESIAPLTVALMARSVGDRQVMVRSQPYHRVALEAIKARHPESARRAMEAHLGVAQELYGEDFERSVDWLAEQSVQSNGLASLDGIVGEVLGRPRDRGKGRAG